MEISYIGFSIHTLGELLIAYTAVKVHFRFWKEHKIDEAVFSVMKKEQLIGIVGIILILVGFIIESVALF